MNLTPKPTVRWNYYLWVRLIECVIPTVYSFLFSLPTHHISTPLGYQPGLSRYKLMPHTLLEDIWLPIMEVSSTTRVLLLSWSPALPLMSCLFFFFLQTPHWGFEHAFCLLPKLEANTFYLIFHYHPMLGFSQMELMAILSASAVFFCLLGFFFFF